MGAMNADYRPRWLAEKLRDVVEFHRGFSENPMTKSEAFIQVPSKPNSQLRRCVNEAGTAWF
jgi:hypothetical protein